MKSSLMILLILCLVGVVNSNCEGATLCSENVYGVSNTLEAVLYYPCTISGSVGATTMTSGYTGTLDQMEWLSEILANNGYVVLAFTPTNIYGMVSGWRDAHKSCIAKLKELNNTHSVLKGKINTAKLSTCGHSKGGGGSLWASAQLGSQLKTTVGLAPWKEEFTSSTLSTIKAATLIQAGSFDTLATYRMTKGEYNALPAIKKGYFLYSAMNHMSWASAYGTTAATLSGSIIAWMKYYLDGQTSYATTLSSTAGQSEHIWVK
ncbi:MAG: hypothetical protein M0036_22795 [Desulfobacteraceae bacterium]|nr:hypothetical protein [Desulfobacteraceae bacterium]